MIKGSVRASGYKRALEVSWLVVIFLVPLFYNPLSHQAFYFNKALLLHFLVLVMLAFSVADWVCNGTRQQKLRRRFFLNSPLQLSVLAFGLLAIIATTVSITPAVSFWGSWARKAGLLTLICWILFFLIVAQQLRSRAQLLRAIYVLLLSSGIVSILGILQYFFPDILLGITRSGRVFSTTGNALSLSIFLAMVMPLCMAFIVELWSRRKEGKNVALLTSLVILLALQFWCLWLAQYSITILLFIIAPIIFIIMLTIIRRKRLLLGLGIFSLLVLGIVAGLLLVPLVSSDIKPEIPETEDVSSVISTESLGLTTLDFRVQLWRSAIDMILHPPQIPFSNDRPHSFRTFIGYGPETFAVVSQLSFPEKSKSFYTHYAMLSGRPHNHYLYLAATTGLLGLAGFLSILVVFFYLCARYLRRSISSMDKLLLIALIAGIAQYMADSLFNPSTLSPELVFWLMLGLLPVIGRLASSSETISVGIESQEVTQPINDGISHVTRSRTYLSLGCTVFLIVIGIGITVRPFLADIQLQKGLNLQAKKNEQALFAFTKAVETEPSEAAYWSHLGKYSYYTAQRIGDASMKSNFLAFGIAAYSKALELEPYIAYRYYSLADVYVYSAKEGAVDKWPAALSLYDKALQLFPRNAVILDKWALALIVKGDFTEAWKKLDYAASVDFDWAETSFLSGLLLAREGRYNEAVNQIIVPVQKNPVNLEYFMDLCSNLAVYGMGRPLGDALISYPQKVSDEWIPNAMLGITSFFDGSLEKSLDYFGKALLLVPDEDTVSLFRIISRFSRVSPSFKMLLPEVASDG